MIDEDFVVPYDKQRLVSEIHDEARVLSEEYDERGARLRVRALPETLARLRHAVSG
jgi:GTP-binding protein HflX